MNVCEKCEKQHLSAVGCPYCGHVNNEGGQAPAAPDRQRLHWSELTSTSKFVVVCWALLLGWQTLFIAPILSYFVFGPWCCNIARDNNRDEQFGFLIGYMFIPLGILCYWLYVKAVGPKE